MKRRRALFETMTGVVSPAMPAGRPPGNDRRIGAREHRVASSSARFGRAYRSTLARVNSFLIFAVAGKRGRIRLLPFATACAPYLKQNRAAVVMRTGGRPGICLLVLELRTVVGVTESGRLMF